MIYDCFAFFNELDLLEIRLNELNDVVDRFVLVEATRTFQQQPKPLYFEENKERYKKFLHKIEHIVVDKFPGFFYKFRKPNTWDYDNYQKDQLALALKDCKDDDFVVMSDLDEIPHPGQLKAHATSPGIKVFEQRFHLYYLNWVQVKKENPSEYDYWYGSVMCDYATFRRKLKTMKKLRMRRDVVKFQGNTIIQNGGWHFTYLGGVEKIIQKLEAYTHSEHNVPEIKDADRIKKVLENKTSLFDDSIRCVVEEIDENYPVYLQKNKDKYQSLVAKD